MRAKLYWIAIGIVCVFLTCLSMNYDYDLFARLIVGERFVEHGILPFKDFLSYTPTHPWYDHEWGSGVIFYLILKYLGPAGLIFTQALMMFFITFFVVKIQKFNRHAYPQSLIFTSFFLIVIYALNIYLIRCQLFSFLFFTVYLYLLEKYRHTGSKTLWLIPLITVFWNNVHGGVVSGIGLILIYLICAIIEKKSYLEYFKVLLFSFCALIINPYGVKYLSFLFSAATMSRKYIVEWWPFYTKSLIHYYIVPVMYGLYGTGVKIYYSVKLKKCDITKIAVLLITMYEGLIHVKLLSLFVIAVAAFCYDEIFKSFIWCKKQLKTFNRTCYASVIAISLLIPFSSPWYPRANFEHLPLYEIEFLKINNIKGNIVVPFGFGSYATYKLYPDNLVYMDGRYEEVYNNQEFLALRNFELYESNWDDIIKNYDTKILMPEKTVEVYEHLKNNKDWVHIFDGRLCGIFVKKEDVKKSYYEPEYDIAYYRRTMFLGYFGNKIKNTKDKIKG